MFLIVLPFSEGLPSAARELPLFVSFQYPVRSDRSLQLHRFLLSADLCITPFKRSLYARAQNRLWNRRYHHHTAPQPRGSSLLLAQQTRRHARPRPFRRNGCRHPDGVAVFRWWLLAD